MKKYVVKTTEYRDVFDIYKKIGPFNIWVTCCSTSAYNNVEVIKRAAIEKLGERTKEGKVVVEFKL